MLEFSKKTDRQLKLSKLSALKGLKLSKVSKRLEVVFARGHLRVREVRADPFQNMLLERAEGELGSLSQLAEARPATWPKNALFVVD